MRRTLVKVDAQMSPLWKRERGHQVGIFSLQLCAHSGELIFGKQPVFALGRFPVIGSHIDGGVLSSRCV